MQKPHQNIITGSTRPTDHINSSTIIIISTQNPPSQTSTTSTAASGGLGGSGRERETSPELSPKTQRTENGALSVTAKAKVSGGSLKEQPLSPSVSKNSSTTAVVEQKPVECNLCQRRFKNVPALNGHMRLHGGYFKKESEAKRGGGVQSGDRKEASGPPLQTASIGIRALIEERIISKRSKELKVSLELDKDRERRTVLFAGN